MSEKLEGKWLVVLVEGRLTADDLAALDEFGSTPGGACVLDLSRLQAADAAGSKRLRELASSGLAIRGVSPYVRLLIDGGS